MTEPLVAPWRSSAWHGHEEAADRLVAMLEPCGLILGDWRTALEDMRDAARDLEEEAERKSRLLDDDEKEGT